MRGIRPSVGSSSRIDLGLEHHRARDGEHLLLAARQPCRQADCAFGSTGK